MGIPLFGHARRASVGSQKCDHPLSAMDDSGDDTLFLNLDKHQVESLPTFPVHRL